MRTSHIQILTKICIMTVQKKNISSGVTYRMDLRVLMWFVKWAGHYSKHQELLDRLN
jgi:hypothetical protein